MPDTPPPSICVFCGSRPGTSPAYMKSADALGSEMGRAGFRLVYGAGDIGLMGAVARAAQAAGGETFGVIPVHLLEREVGKRDLGTFVVTETMHERKKVMLMNAQAIVTLPGGPGSLDELFEMLTWRQLGLHDKPVYLLNVDGYWDPILTMIDQIIAHGFAEPSFRDYLEVVGDVPALMTLLRDRFSNRQRSTE